MNPNQSMKLLFTISCIFLLSVSYLQAQNSWQLGAEIQGYPAGFIVGIRSDYNWKHHQSINMRLGYNFAYHRDLGVHENEEGGGPGFSFGYTYYFGENHKGFHLGVRGDIWHNTIDWMDNIGTVDEVSGSTEIIVLQPTLVGGYQFLMANDHFVLTPQLGFGWEINVNQNGEDVGEGAIFLFGFFGAYRF